MIMAMVLDTNGLSTAVFKVARLEILSPDLENFEVIWRLKKSCLEIWR